MRSESVSYAVRVRDIVGIPCAVEKKTGSSSVHVNNIHIYILNFKIYIGICGVLDLLSVKTV